MSYLSRKNLPGTFDRFTKLGGLPLELEPYRNIMNIVCERIQYTPDIREVVLSIGLATHDDKLIRTYFSREYNELDEKGLPVEPNGGFYREAYRSRISRFDTENPILEKVLNCAKQSHLEWKTYFKNDYMGEFVGIIYALSTDYAKKENRESLLNQGYEDIFFIIEMISSMIAAESFSEDDYANLVKLNNQFGNLFLKNANVISKSHYYSLGACNLQEKNAPLSVFSARLLEYLLLQKGEECYPLYSEIMNRIFHGFIFTGKIDPIVLKFSQLDGRGMQEVLNELVDGLEQELTTENKQYQIGTMNQVQ